MRVYGFSPGLHPYQERRACDILAASQPAWRPVNLHSLDSNIAIPVKEEYKQERQAPSNAPLNAVACVPTPMTLVEAVLFLAKEPLSGHRISQLAGLPEGTKVQKLIRELNKRYDRNQSSFCVVEVAGGFQLRTRAEFAPWIVRITGISLSLRLSNPAMETLTVIAYRQPVPRTEVERIRGVQCGELIRQLLEHDLAKIVGRSDELGRPFLYGTTPKFLSTFGLRSLSDLPKLVFEEGVSTSH